MTGLRDRAARLVWLGAGALVAIYPFAWPVAVVRWRPRPFSWRREGWWLAALVGFGAVSLVHGAVDGALWVTLGAYATYRAGEGFAQQGGRDARIQVRRGLLVALFFLTGWATWQAWGWGLGRASGPTWFGHPNQFAHAMIALAVLAASSERGPWRGAALLAGSAAVLQSGSRSGVLAWFIVVVALGVRPGWRRAVVAVGTMVAFAGAIAFSVEGGTPWIDRLLAPVRTVVAGAPAKNLLIATENLVDATRWNHLGVAVDRQPGPSPARWLIERRTSESWARPQQRVAVEAGVPYTLSGEFSEATGRAPGFLVFGRVGDVALELRAGVADGGATVFAQAGAEVRGVVVTDVGDGWQRLSVTFVVAVPSVREVAVGPSPGVSSEAAAGDRVLVRALQWEQGTVATAYEPTPVVVTGFGEASARFDLFRVALDGIAQAPWTGQGPGRFAAYAAAANDRLAGTPHAHNLFLDAAFRGGVLALAALLALIVALWSPARAPVRTVIVGLLIANLVDATFLSATVLFPLAWSIGTGERDRRQARPRGGGNRPRRDVPDANDALDADAGPSGVGRSGPAAVPGRSSGSLAG